MIRIALTGPSGSGKGHVSKIFSSYGIACLDTDSVVHSLYEKGELADRLADLFGKNVLSQNGCVNRKELAKIVFSDSDKLKLLNQTVHAAVKIYVKDWLEQQQNAGASAASARASV